MPYPLNVAIERAKKRFLSLLMMVAPSAVVIKEPHYLMSRGAILRLLKRESARRSIPMLILTQDDVCQAFGIHRRNKFEIAEALTRVFPELIFKLPPRRAEGDSERHVMIVFDAIATGYACLQSAQMPLSRTE